jgi:hypothetical protein
MTTARHNVKTERSFPASDGTLPTSARIKFVRPRECSRWSGRGPARKGIGLGLGQGAIRLRAPVPPRPWANVTPACPARSVGRCGP